MGNPAIDIDGALVARTLELDIEQFRTLMNDGKIAVLCERGTGEDTGRYRASFYYAGKRARFILDETGRVLDEPTAQST